jgi:branched-chain amino acid transport system substrate-binding protein
MSMLGTRRYLATALCVGVLLLAACTEDAGNGGGDGNGDGGQPFVIGLATAQTGVIAPFDVPAVEGFEIGVDELNAAGGIDGTYPVELEFCDGRSDAAQSAVCAQELIDSGVDFLIVPCDGDLVLAAGPIGQQAQIPTMTLCASPPILTDEVGDFMFGNTFGDNVQATVLADFAVEQGYETAYYLNSPDSLYTQDVPEYFAEAFEARGGEMVGFDAFSIGQQDFSAIVTRIQNLQPQPDVIMTSAYEPDFPAFIQQLRGAGVDTPVLGSDGIDTPTIVEIGRPAEGVVFSGLGFPVPDSPLEAFYEKYEEVKGQAPETPYTAVGFDATVVIDAAVSAAGSTDPTEVRDALASLEDVQGATGAITYAGTNRMPVKQVTLLRIEGEERVLIGQFTPDPSEVPSP